MSFVLFVQCTPQFPTHGVAGEVDEGTQERGSRGVGRREEPPQKGFVVFFFF